MKSKAQPKTKAQKSKTFWTIGQAYLIRTITMYWLGKVVGINDQELLLESASWIPWTGRYSETSSNGKLDEIEVVQGRVIVGRGAIIDAIEWKHDLPKESK